jgi:glycosyltransferase involved in cell wall biosynthesis
VLVPVCDEEPVLPEFHRRLAAALDGLPAEIEILYVNDGSRDASLARLEELHRADGRVAVVDLSRRFGKEAALSAGLDESSGDAVVIIDADLQDPPELIPAMVEAWRDGHDVVLMRRGSRARESWARRAAARLFYLVLGRSGDVEIPSDAGDFRLVSRRAVLALRRFPERVRFMKGLFAWIGFRTAEIVYEREARRAGGSKWSASRLFELALDGLTSFSVAPLRLLNVAGLLAAVAGLGYAAKLAAWALFYGEPVGGIPVLIVAVLFLGGLQLLALGLLGEYVARVFIEIKQRPLYLVQRRLRASRPIAATEHAA